MARDQVDAYLQKHGPEFEEQLKALIRIPSVSAQPDHNADTLKAAEFVRDDLKRMGVPAELITFPKGHPIVYGERLDAPGKPTLLVYGHYDVQPAEPLEPWLSPPFEPTVRDGNLYARGATDDKGQMFTHLKAAEAWLKGVGRLPINVKFLIEGEEEVGGVNLEGYVAANPQKLACDYAVISDTSQFAPGMPAITYGLKGLAYFELRVQGANRDLHSGTFGGAVRNPLNALAAILASFHNDQGRIAIAGFYDDVKPLEAWERKEFAALPFSEADFQADLKVNALAGEAGYSTLERKWARPTCDVNGIWGGYSGPGPKTVLPCKAGAKFSFRLVPDQDHKRIAALLRKHIESVAPSGITWELEEMHGAPAVLVEVKGSKGVDAAVKAVESGFGTKPVFMREGGSIPVVGLLKKHLGVDTLLLGWGQNDDNLHGPNEKFSLADFHKGIKAARTCWASWERYNHEGKRIHLSEMREGAMPVKDFFVQIRSAQSLLTRPRVTTDSTRLDSAEMARSLERADLWLTPRIVAGFDPDDFAFLNHQERNELTTAVNRFREVASQVAVDRPATPEESCAARKELETIIRILKPSEYQNASQLITAKVLERLRRAPLLADSVAGIDYQFNWGFLNEPGVWIWLVVPDDLARSPDFFDHSERLREVVEDSLTAHGVTLQPHVRFRSVSEQHGMEPAAFP